MNHEAEGGSDNSLVTEAVTMDITMFHNSYAEGFMVGTFKNILISVRVSLVIQFRHCFRYQIGFSLVIEVLMVRVSVNHRGVFS